MKKFLVFSLFLIFNCVSSEPISNEQFVWCLDQYDSLLTKNLDNNSLDNLDNLKTKANIAAVESLQYENSTVTELYEITQEEYWSIVENIENTFPEFREIKGDYKKIYEITHSSNNPDGVLLADYPLLDKLNLYFEITMLKEKNTFSELHCKIWEEISN